MKRETLETIAVLLFLAGVIALAIYIRGPVPENNVERFYSFGAAA